MKRDQISTKGLGTERKGGKKIVLVLFLGFVISAMVLKDMGLAYLSGICVGWLWKGGHRD